MTTSTPPDNTVLVLLPPMVNGQTKPVVGAHIGLSLVNYDLVTDGEGAYVLVDPPLKGTMDRGDIMELWLENEPAALDSKTIEDPDVRTTLRIPKGRLHPDKVNKLYYTVKRGSSNIGTSEPMLEILYNRIRPGLKDRLTDPGGHSELKLLLPDVIKNGVGPDFVSAEVCVAYPYCRAYDVITLKCNGELLEPKPRVNPNQAPQPPNPGSETPITICFTITRAFLDKAKREDKKLDFVFSVTDQIGNGPDTDAPWSPVQTVDEDLDGVLLPMPILLERLEDFPGDDASIIDLEKLAGNPLLVVVLTADNRFVAGDEVLATYTAKNTGQPTDVVVTVPGKVEADPFGSKKTLFLEVPYDKVFAGSSVTVTYELRRPNSDLVGSSNTAKATVTDTAPIDLKPEITSVTDSLNKEIPHNGGTVDPQVKLTGTATPRQRVEVFEGGTSKGKWPVNADGEWTYETTLSGVGTRTFTAKADYGMGQISAERIFTLSDALTPAIDSAKDSGGVEIPNNGFTSDTTIKLSGTATPRLEVEIIDDTVSIGKATVSDAGVWSHQDNDLAEGNHSYKAKALYGSGQVSAERNLTAVSALSVDTSPVSLSGLNYTVDLAAVGWELTGTDLPNTAVTRPATGGKAPYTYASSAPGIVSVDSSGTIRSVANGAATITVSDASGQSRDILVNASNVRKVLYGGTNLSHTAAQAWMRSVGGSPFPPNSTDVNQLNVKFRVLVAGNHSERRYFPGWYITHPGLPTQTGFTWVQTSGSGMGPFIPASTGSQPGSYIALCIAKME
ncbi:Ig-like domain-containing protein [Pseudomonas fluorescens]|uniref:Ig-like domain-containing protein n=1 Tax=Pseudomonas fluorescens TaxID=294 RepID=UPI00068E6ED6|nr:Ig-like domain-containing protein [Pseudomonas fluorescens]